MHLIKDNMSISQIDIRIKYIYLNLYLLSKKIKVNFIDIHIYFSYFNIVLALLSKVLASNRI